MPDPNDHEMWTPEDDDLVRRALFSLREDVDHLPLAPVETVKSRGGRRRRSTWITGAAGLAAAAVVVGAVALSGVLTAKPDVTAPATRSHVTTTATTTRPTPTSADDWHATADWATLLAKPGILPTGAEWAATLGVDGVTAVEGMLPTDLLCLMTPGAATAVSSQDVVIPGKPDTLGVQVTWIYPTDKQAQDAANAMREKADNCTTPKPEAITSVSSDRYSEHSMLWRFSDSDRNSGWLTVTDRGRQITYVEFWGQKDGTSMLTLDKFAWITNRVENRLERYGESSSAGPVITGPDTLTPAASLFIDPTDFASTVFTGGAQTASGAGEFDGSSAVVPCDSDTSGQGEFGLLKVKLAGKDASYFATERLRAFTDPAATDTAATDLGAALAACTKDVGGNPVHVTAGPAQGTYAMTTDLGAGTTFTQFVAIQVSTDGSHLATLVVSPQNKVDQAEAFAELIRLRGLAADR